MRFKKLLLGRQLELRERESIENSRGQVAFVDHEYCATICECHSPIRHDLDPNWLKRRSVIRRSTNQGSTYAQRNLPSLPSQIRWAYWCSELLLVCSSFEWHLNDTSMWNRERSNAYLPEVWYDSVLASSFARDNLVRELRGFSASSVGTWWFVITSINWLASWLFSAF